MRVENLTPKLSILMINDMLPHKMFQYKAAVLKWFVRKHKNTKYLRYVHPIVFYTGEKIYSKSPSLIPLFEKEHQKLARDYMLNPDKQYEMVDFSQITEEEILRQYDYFQLIGLMAKFPYVSDLMKMLMEIREVAAKALAREESDLVTQAWHYMIFTRDLSASKEYTEVMVRQLEEEVGDKNTMNLADYLRKEGFKEAVLASKYLQEQAKAEGLEEKEHEMVQRMLDESLPLEVISKISKMSIEDIKKQFMSR